MCNSHKYIGSTTLGLPPKKDYTHPSFTVEISCPAKGPKLSITQRSYFLSLASGISSFLNLFSSPSFVYSSFLSTALFSTSTFSSFGLLIVCIFSMMKMTPIICSLASGPEEHANQNPFLTEVISYFMVVLYS